MHILSEHESKIYELIRVGIQPTDIAKLAGYHKASTLYTIVQRLTTLGFLEKKISKNRVALYEPLITEYEVMDSKGLRLLSRNRHMLRPIPFAAVADEPYGKIQVTNAQRRLIFDLRMSGKRTSVISAALGLPRYVVNKEIIYLGIKQE